MKSLLKKLIIIFFLPFLLGNTVGGCDELLLEIYELAGFTSESWNASTFGSGSNYNYRHFIHDYYFAQNDGLIRRWNGDDDFEFVVSFFAPGEPNLYDIKFDSVSVDIVCVGSYGTVLRKGSGEWQVKNSGTTETLNKILVSHITANGSEKFVVGNNGTVLKSTDDGETWQLLTFPTMDDLKDITENAEGKIFVSGENYCFYSTADDGNTWEVEGPSNVNRSGPSSSYNKIYFYDENIGYVGGPNGLILKTTDGGSTWGIQVASDFQEINDLFFISPDSGVAVGPYGVARLTTDGGDNWIENDDLTTFLNGETLKRIFPVEKNYGLVVGENGFDIFVAKDSTFLDSLPLVTTVEYEDILVEEFQLLQNYPNPFNPSTTISWQSPVGSHQTLKIYDMLGNEIATLVDEYKPAGSYKVSFDASALTSGIYFYRLQAGSLVETKKMILLR